MHVVILAAGRGTRLGPHTSEMPKSLLPLSGKAILEHIFDSLEGFSIDSITIVGGFQFDLLKAKLAGRKVNLVFNPDYQAGNLLTLLAAKPFIKTSFCLFNADHLYTRPILKKIFSSPDEAIRAVCDFDRPLVEDDMKVRLHDGRVKEMDKKLSSYDAGYIGSTLVPQKKLSLYWKTAEALLKEKGEGVNVEQVLNRLVTGGEPVDIVDAGGSVWIEVDTPVDYERAEKLIGEVRETFKEHS